MSVAPASAPTDGDPTKFEPGVVVAVPPVAAAGCDDSDDCDDEDASDDVPAPDPEPQPARSTAIPQAIAARP